MRVIQGTCFVMGIVLAGCGSGGAWDPPAPAPENVGRTSDRLATTPGTWTPMVAPPPIHGGATNLELMTDGSVLLSDGTTHYYKLTPDTTGSYVNGTWTEVGRSHLTRVFNPSAMLRDGRFLIGGGEYVAGTDHATIEIYDPVADAWTFGPDMPDPIGDTAASILPDGRFFSSSNATSNTYLYDPVANSWTLAGLIGTGGSGDEKGWTLLQDGTVLDAFDVASRYNPATNTWTATGALPVSLVGLGEIGPMSLLQSGKVVQFGGAAAPAVGHTALYDPTTNLWTPSADAPDGLQFADSSATVLVNGHVLCSTTQFLSGGAVAAMWEYDPDAPSGSPLFTKVADGTAAFPGNPMPLLEPIMVALPNGQVLVTQEPDISTAAAFSVYTPSGAPQSSWRPTITSVSAPASGVFTLAGTQLNGLTNGASFGDDMNMASAYPIVYLTDGAGHVYYARSFGFDQMAPKPAASGSCSFTLPTQIPNGTYDVHVSATGIASSNTVPLTVSGEHVTALTGSTSASPTEGALWKVSLAAPAPAGGVTINLTSSNPSEATVPATVTVPQGQTFATFRVTVLGYGYTVVTAETAVPNPSFKPARRAFGWRLASFGGPTMPASGRSTTWSVGIDNAPPFTGTVVALSSSNPAAATVPSTVTIPGGATSITFPVTFTDAGGHTVITASLLGSSMSQSFGYSVTFTPPAGMTGNFDAPRAAGGVEPWTVRIDQPAPAGGAPIQLQSSDTAIATVPATATIPAGATSTTFPVTVGSNPVGNQATVTASIPDSSATGLFGYRITVHQVSPVPVKIGVGASDGTILLNGAAPPAGLPVTYTTPNPAVILLRSSGQTIAPGNNQGDYLVTGLGSTLAIATVRARIGTAGPFRNVSFEVAP